MDAAAAIKAIGESEDAKKLIGADGLSALSKLVGDVDSLTARAKEADDKAGRILKEKKDVQEKLTELTSEVEALKASGLSDAEKLQQAHDKLSGELQAERDKNSALQLKFDQSQRTVAMDKLAGGVKFVDSLGSTAGRILFGSAMAEVDLSDETAVNAAVTAFKENNKGIIAADSQGAGAGTKPSESSAGGGGDEPASTEDREEALQKAGVI